MYAQPQSLSPKRDTCGTICQQTYFKKRKKPEDMGVACIRKNGIKLKQVDVDFY